MSIKFLPLSLVILALAACGSPKKSPDSANAAQGLGGEESAAPILSPGDLVAQCQLRNGFISTDGSFCLAPTSASIPDGQTGRVNIDPNFASGKFLVSTGTPGAVMIVLNGRRISDVNVRMLANQGNGVLSFQVLLPGQSKASAVVYECFDGNMHLVFCNGGVIP